MSTLSFAYAARSVKTLLTNLGKKSLSNTRAWMIVKKDETDEAEPQRYFIQADESIYSDLCAEGWEIHEVICGRSPVRFHMDIDISREAVTKSGKQFSEVFDENDTNPAELTSVIIGFADYFINSVSLCGSAAEKKTIIGYDNGAKYSRHITYINAVLPNGEANKYICAYICDQIQNMYEGDDMLEVIKSAIDPIGTNGMQFMRMHSCPKGGDYSRVLEDCAEYHEYINAIPLPSEMHSYYIYCPNTVPTIAIPSDILPEGKDINAASGNNYISEFPAEHAPAVAELLKQVSTLYKEYTISECNGFNGVRLSRNRPSYCHVCERNHTGMGAYVAIVNNIPRVCCFAAKRQCKKYVSSNNCIVRAHPNYVPVPELATPYTPAPEDAVNTITVEHDKINAAECIDEIEDNYTDSYIISSPWATSKSKFINRAIEHAKNNDQIIIAISSRRTLSYQQITSWGLKNYEGDGLGSYVDPATEKWTNWQLESLRRLDCSKANGALIIVDEYTALSHHASDIDAVAQRVGLNILKSLINKCARYIVADNDINDFQIKSLRIANGNINPRIIRNEWPAFSGCKTTIFTGTKAHDVAEIEIFEHLDRNITPYLAGEKYEPLCIASHDYYGVIGFYERFKARYPAAIDAIAHYTADTKKDKKRADFSNTTVAWKNKLVVIYSPTVSIGISCVLKEFKTVYALYYPNHISAQQSAQALFRCRAVQNLHIYVSTAGRKSSTKLPANENDLLDDIINTRAQKIAPDVAGFTSYNSDIDIITDKNKLGEHLSTFVGTLYVSATLQYNRSMNGFVSELTGILQRSGLTVNLVELKYLHADNKSVTVDEISSIVQQREEAKIYTAIAKEERINTMAKLFNKARTFDTTSAETLEFDPSNEPLHEKATYLLRHYYQEGETGGVPYTAEQVPKVLKLSEKYETDIKAARKYKAYTSAINGESAQYYTGDTFTVIGRKDAAIMEYTRKVINTLETEGFDRCNELYADDIKDKAFKLFGDTHAARKAEGKNSAKNIINIALKPAGMKLTRNADNKIIPAYTWNHEQLKPTL